VEQNKIFTINNLNNKFGRSRFKEFYLKRGSKGEVYGNEVSLEQYLTYTTEKPEKSAVEYYVQKYGNYDEALRKIVDDLKILEIALKIWYRWSICTKTLDDKINSFYRKMKTKHKGKNVFKIISQELEDQNISFSELINKNKSYMKKFSLKIIMLLFSFWGIGLFPKHLHRPTVTAAMILYSENLKAKQNEVIDETSKLKDAQAWVGTQMVASQ
jgi:hypothetical protein